MASEYFSTLQFIWLNIVFFIFALFLFAVCLYACLFVRWVYKRRLRQKTDEMIDAYKNEEEKRKELELRLKKQELKPPSEKKKRSQTKRKIHIVTTPCNQVIKQKSDEYVVRQVNEGASDEYVPEPPQQVAQPVEQAQQVQIVHPVGQSFKTIKSVNSTHQEHLNVHHVEHSTQAYVLVPVDLWNSQKHDLRGSRQDAPAQVHDQESVATQTSDRLVEKTNPQDNIADEWLGGAEEKDGDTIEFGAEIPDADTSDKVMKRRAEFDSKQVKPPKESVPPSAPIEVASEETRVDMDDVPLKFSTSSTTPVTTSSSDTSTATKSSSGSSGPMIPISNSMISPDPSEKEKYDKGKDNSDKTVSSEENSLQLSVPKKPEEKKLSSETASSTSKAPARPSIFPYFVDSGASQTASKAGSKERSHTTATSMDSPSPRPL